MIELLTVALPIIFLFIFSIIGCTCCCFCWWLVPLRRLFSGTTTIRNDRKEYSHYEMSSTNNPAIATAIAATDNEVPVVEAYVVPPLAIVEAESVSAQLESHRNLSTQQRTLAAQNVGFKDKWASVLFGINVLVIFAFALKTVIYAKHADPYLQPDTPAVEGNIGFTQSIIFILGCFAIAISLSFFFLSVLIRYSARLIEWTMYLNIFTVGFAAISALLSGQLFTALMFGILAGVNYWYYLSVQDMIPFASTILSTACTAVQDHFSGLLTLCFVGVGCQLLWLLLWLTAAAGVYANFLAQSDQQKQGDDNNLSATQLCIFFLLALSAYWGIEVIKYLLVTTCQGTVACWWFHPSHLAPLYSSLFRAVTINFGSICFGALILSLIEALRFIGRILKQAIEQRRIRGDGEESNRANNALQVCCLLVIDCLLQVVERMLLYFNRYAFGYIAAYGYDYHSAGVKVIELFERRGWMAIINDNLITNTLSILILFLTFLTGLCSAFFVSMIYPWLGMPMSFWSNYAVVGGLLGAAVGYLVASLVITCLLDSAIVMIYICFAEDPLALERHHPHLYASLYYHWDHCYPQTLNWIQDSTPLMRTAAIREPEYTPVVAHTTATPSAPPYPPVYQPSTTTATATAKKASAVPSYAPAYAIPPPVHQSGPSYGYGQQRSNGAHHPHPPPSAQHHSGHHSGGW